MSILKIDSSARLNDSNSRVLTEYLVNCLVANKNSNDHTVVNRDLLKEPLPAISAEDLMDLHNGQKHERASLQQHILLAAQLIKEVKSADTLVFGVPIYNFTVPTVLKQWIDYIVQAGATFQYGANGAEGLSGVKKAYIITASGGTPIGSPIDFASTYLEAICKFIGVEEVYQIDASGSKGTPEVVVAQAKQQIDEILGIDK